MHLDVRGGGGLLKCGTVHAAALASWRLCSVGEPEDEADQVFRLDAELIDVDPIWINATPLTVMLPLMKKLRMWEADEALVSHDDSMKYTVRLMLKGWPPRTRGNTDGSEVWHRHQHDEDSSVQRPWGLLD